MEQHKEIVELTNSTRKLIKLLANLYILSEKELKRYRKTVRSFLSIAPCCDSPVDPSLFDCSIHDVLIIKMHKQDKNYPEELVINFASVPQDLKSHFQFTMGLIHRIIYPCVQKPIVIFNAPICCLSNANISIEQFRSEFTLFLRMRPRLMEFEEFYAFCKVLLLTFNKVVFTRTCCNGCHIKKKITRQMSTLNMHIFYQFSLYLFYRHINKFNVDVLDLMLIYKKLNNYVGWNYFKTSLMFFKRGVPIKFTRRSEVWLGYYTKHASRPDLTLLSETEAETFYFLNELCDFDIKIEKNSDNNEIYSDHIFSLIGLTNLDPGQSVASDQFKNASVKKENDFEKIASCKIVKESISVQSNEKITEVLQCKIEDDSLAPTQNLNNRGTSTKINKINTKSPHNKSQLMKNNINKIQRRGKLKSHIYSTRLSKKNKDKQQRYENRVQIVEVSENSNSSSDDEVQVLSNPNINEVIGILDDSDSSVENLGEFFNRDYEKDVICVSDDSTSRNQYTKDGSRDLGSIFNKIDNEFNDFINSLRSGNEGSSSENFNFNYDNSLSAHVEETKLRDERARSSVDEGWKTIDHYRFFSSLEGVKAGPSNDSKSFGVKDITEDRAMEISRLKSGKEELDEIEEIKFISFETESDMIDYTRREMLGMIKHFSNKHRNHTKSSLPQYIAQKHKNIKKTISVNENKTNLRVNEELKMLDDYLKSINPHNVDDLFDEDCKVTQSIPPNNQYMRKQVEKSSLERHMSTRPKRKKSTTRKYVDSMSSDSEDVEPNFVQLEDNISNSICDSRLSEENGECFSRAVRINDHKHKNIKKTMTPVDENERNLRISTELKMLDDYLKSINLQRVDDLFDEDSNVTQSVPSSKAHRRKQALRPLPNDHISFMDTRKPASRRRVNSISSDSEDVETIVKPEGKMSNIICDSTLSEENGEKINSDIHTNMKKTINSDDKNKINSELKMLDDYLKSITAPNVDDLFDEDTKVTQSVSSSNECHRKSSREKRRKPISRRHANSISSDSEDVETIVKPEGKMSNVICDLTLSEENGKKINKHIHKNMKKTINSDDENQTNSKINVELKNLDDYFKSITPPNVDDLFDEDTKITQSNSSSNECRRKSSLEGHMSSREKRRKPTSRKHDNSMSSDSEDVEPNVVKPDDRISNVTNDSSPSKENGECFNRREKINDHKLNSGFENPSILGDLKRKVGIIPSTVKLERLSLEMIPHKEKTTNFVKDDNDSIELGEKTQNNSINNESELSLLNSCEVENVVHLENVPKYHINKLPIILPCNDVNGEHDGCLNVEKCKNITLGLVLNIGKNCSFPKEVSENLDLLKNNSNIVDDRWALIAASAVVQRNAPETPIKRVLVPVVSKPLLEKAVLHLNLLADWRNCANEVKNVVSDIVDYVANRDFFENLTYQFDPDVPFDRKPIKCSQKKQETSKVERELRRLVNVTVINQCSNKSQTQETGKCFNDFCLKGCVCDSLNQTHTLSHCYELKCMFNCICSDKKVSDNHYNLRRSKDTLTQEESSWHQTVIYKDNSIEFKGDIGRSKRTKKMPARFQDDILYGTEMMLNIREEINHINRPNPQQSIRKDLKDAAKSSHQSKQVNKSTKKSPTTSCKPETIKNDFKPDQLKIREQHQLIKDKENCKPAKITENVEEEEIHSDDIEEETHSDSIEEESRSDTIDKDTSWADEYWLWCAVHSCYGCKCSSQLYFLKTALDCGTAEKISTLMKKEIPDLISHDNVCHLYNKTKHSARTFGAVMDYSKRNKSVVFKSKRLYEIQNDIGIFSNSLIKAKLTNRNFAVTGYIKEKESKDISDADNSKQKYKKANTAKKSTTQLPFSNIKKKTINFDMACKPSFLKPHDNSKNNVNTENSLQENTLVVKQVESNSSSDPLSLNIVASPISLAKLFPSPRGTEPIAAEDGELNSNCRIEIMTADSDLCQSMHDDATDFNQVPSASNEEDLKARDLLSPLTISGNDFKRIRISTSNEEILKALIKQSPSFSNATDFNRIRPSKSNEEILKALNMRSPSTSSSTDFTIMRRPKSNEEILKALSMWSPSTSSVKDFNRIRPSTSNEEILKALNKRTSPTSNAADFKRMRSISNEETLTAHDVLSPSTSNATDFNKMRPSTNKDQSSSISSNNLLGNPITVKQENQLPLTTNIRPKIKYRIGPAYSNTRAIKVQPAPIFPNKLKTVPVLSKVNPDDYTTLKMISAGFTNTKDHTVIFPQNNNSNLNQDVSPPNNTEPHDSETEDETYGLLCLAKGFGYLAVQSVSGESIVVEDPLAPQVYHSFSNTRAAVKWLNKFLKNRLLFEDPSITLPWALVKGNTLKRYRPFDRTVFQTKSKMVTKKGELVSKGTYHWLNTAAQAKRVLNRSTVIVDPLGNVSAIAKRPAQDDPNLERKKLKKITIQSITFDNGVEIQMARDELPTIQISDDEDESGQRKRRIIRRVNSSGDGGGFISFADSPSTSNVFIHKTHES